MLISCFLVTVMGYSQEAVNFDPPAVAPSFQAVETTDTIFSRRKADGTRMVDGPGS